MIVTGEKHSKYLKRVAASIDRQIRDKEFANMGGYGPRRDFGNLFPVWGI